MSHWKVRKFAPAIPEKPVVALARKHADRLEPGRPRAAHGQKHTEAQGLLQALAKDVESNPDTAREVRSAMAQIAQRVNGLAMFHDTSLGLTGAYFSLDKLLEKVKLELDARPSPLLDSLAESWGETPGLRERRLADEAKRNLEPNMDNDQKYPDEYQRHHVNGGRRSGRRAPGGGRSYGRRANSNRGGRRHHGYQGGSRPCGPSHAGYMVPCVFFAPLGSGVQVRPLGQRG